MLEKTTRLNLLFDFYHLLLTEKQRHYMALYYQEDYSLGEIADQFQVSRQAVYEHVKRGEKLLLKYEELLGLVRKYEERQQLLEQALRLLKTDQPDLEELERLILVLKEVE